MRQFMHHARAIFFALALAPSILQAAEPLGSDSQTGLLDGVVGSEPRALQLDPRATLEIVARRMGVELDLQIPAPAIRFESVTKLARFQDAAERQWGFRPERFVNAFVGDTNEIYLIDDPSFYAAVKQPIEESLAHELVHYVQARYGRANLYDWAEGEAVAIQKWFRAEYLDSHGGLLASAPD